MILATFLLMHPHKWQFEGNIFGVWRVPLFCFASKKCFFTFSLLCNKKEAILPTISSHLARINIEKRPIMVQSVTHNVGGIFAQLRSGTKSVNGYLWQVNWTILQKTESSTMLQGINHSQTLFQVVFSSIYAPIPVYNKTVYQFLRLEVPKSIITCKPTITAPFYSLTKVLQASAKCKQILIE